ncbi:MAG: hypothetical protein R3C10_10190 [Pirellulales bacterium]
MQEQLLPPSFLFRFAAPCRFRERVWVGGRTQLDESYRLPTFGSIDDRGAFAEVRVGWSEAAIALSVRVRGKRKPPRCDVGNPTDGDGFWLWIDTRRTDNVHRATRFCHQFVMLPAGGGRGRAEPIIEHLRINRAREDAHPIRHDQLGIHGEVFGDGYQIEAALPGQFLTGFDPAEHQEIGFHYAVVDTELGVQTFSCPVGFPYQEDPSLWATLQLVRD